MSLDRAQHPSPREDEGIGADEPFLGLVGKSSAFVDLLKIIRRFARCDAPVLVEGETGTGKEAAARAIHYLSERRDCPFVPVNCGAIPDSLVEAEFFGHERGAFTDAREARAGVIAQARGGTLFLDEIEALSQRGQVALLRFLQEGEYRPIGAMAIRSADVRVIAASNADLDALVDQGVYRRDLLYRLNVLHVRVPPLRNRDRDALLLAETFLGQLSRRYGTPRRALDAGSVDFVLRHSWPGNVRELQNLLHREFLLSEGPTIRLGGGRGQVETPAPGAAGLTEMSFRAAKARAIASFERSYILELLERAQGNISLAARIAGKDRSRLGKLVRKHGVAPAAFFRSRKP